MSEFKKYDQVPTWIQAVWNGDKVELPAVPTTFLWSGKIPPPAVGSNVFVNMNNLGIAKIVGYFTEGPWLGVITELYNPPEWYVRQNKGNPPGYAFGAELREAPKGISPIDAFAIMAVAGALRLYAKTKIKANTSYTPTKMLAFAKDKTGKDFKRTEYVKAAEALDALVWGEPA